MGLPAEVLDRTEALLTAPCQEPAFRVLDPSPRKRSPRYVPGVRFDIERVARVIAVGDHLVHIKGEWRGRPFEWQPWQVQHILAPVFGWVVPHDSHRGWVRLRRAAYIETPRKNGKTTGASVLAISALTADDEPAPEVTIGAYRKKQARRLFEPARDMMLASPRLSSRVRSITDLVRVPRNGGELTIASSEADGEHGGNIHQFFVDELHVLPSADLLEVLETGTGARVQPLGWIFTTADEGDAGTVYDQRRREIESLATGAVDWEPTTYGAVWCAGDADDPFEPATWEKANPNIGVSITREYLAREAEKARRNPQYLPTFERLHLGKRRRTETRWLPIDYYQASDHSRSFDDLVGSDVWGAVDLSAVDDFTALVWWCPRRITSPAMGDTKSRRVEGGIAVARIWCTESGVRRRPRMARQLETWQNQGWLTITPGDAIDYSEIRTQLLADASVFGATKGIGFDPWNARQFAQELQDDHGLPMIEVPQTMKSLAGGAQRLEQLVLQRAVATDGNPVLRWMVSNAVARRDPDNRVRPDKKRSGQKIDAVSAWVSALAIWLDAETLPNLDDQFV